MHFSTNIVSQKEVALGFRFNDDVINTVCDVIYVCDDVIYASDDVIFPSHIVLGAYSGSTQKSETMVVEKWEFKLLRVDDVMKSLDDAHV